MKWASHIREVICYLGLQELEKVRLLRLLLDKLTTPYVLSTALIRLTTLCLTPY